MNDLQIFVYSGEQLRTVQRDDGLWWVLRDVCRVLNIQNAADIKKRLDDDEKGVGQIYTPGGTQEMTIINEPGLYAVILRSDKPEAKAFKRWVNIRQSWIGTASCWRILNASPLRPAGKRTKPGNAMTSGARRGKGFATMCASGKSALPRRSGS